MEHLVIGTKRLLLKPCGLRDVAFLYRLWNDADVRKWFWDGARVSHAKVKEAVAASVSCFSLRGLGLWTVRSIDAANLVGAVGFLTHDHPFFDSDVLEQREDMFELFYSILPDFRGRGYATEASEAILRFGFEVVGLNRVVAIADGPNVASVRVLQKVGMKAGEEISISGQTVCLFSRER
jgi:RimJ/RimL family protein N-acetyltransferase